MLTIQSRHETPVIMCLLKRLILRWTQSLARASLGPDVPELSLPPPSSPFLCKERKLGSYVLGV